MSSLTAAELRRHPAGLVGVVPQVRARHLRLELGPALRAGGRAQVPLGLARGACGATPARPARSRCVARPGAAQAAPWQSLNFLPLPHQHGSLRPIFSVGAFTSGAMGLVVGRGAGARPGPRRRLAAAAHGSTPGGPRRRRRSTSAGDGGPHGLEEARPLDGVLGRLVAGLGQVGLGGGARRPPGRA